MRKTKIEELREWRAKNPELRAAQRERARLKMAEKLKDPEYRKRHNATTNATYHRRKHTNREVYLWSSAKKRAKVNGWDFDIEVSDICIPDVCPVLGMDLVKGEGRATGSSPSLDRIDSSKGYIKGNVQVISKKANTMKHDATREELVKFAEWVLREFTVMDGTSGGSAL